jgi:O-antigen/teichoic acid export membrane protein
MGISPTINREVARHSANGRLSDAGNLLHSLAVLYWGLAALIALAIVALAPAIAHFWLHAQNLSSGTLTTAVMLIGLIIGCRWTVSLYLGAVNGAQRLVVSSAIGVASSTMSSFGAIAILAWVSPTIEAFFLWQVAVSLAQAAVARHAAWKILGGAQSARFDSQELTRVWRFSAGMAGVALSSILFTQFDKLLLSKLLDLGQFGQYMLATAAASGLYLIVVPIFNVIYPQFSALLASGENARLSDLYRTGTQALASLLFPAAFALALYAQDIVFLWTGNAAIASATAPIIALLSVGSALHGVMYFPYALQVASGTTRLPILINVCLTLAFVPLVVVLTLRYGAMGAAASWLVLHVLYLLLGTWLTHRSLLKGLGSTWLLHDVGMPLLINIAVAALGYNAVPEGASSVSRMAWAAVTALASCLVSIALLPRLRVLARPYLSPRPGKQA